MIGVVLKNDEGEEEQTRFTYNVTDTPDDDGEGQRVYCTIQRVLTDDEIRAQVVEQAMRQLQSWRDRYRQYSEFAKVFNALAEIEQAIG